MLDNGCQITKRDFYLFIYFKEKKTQYFTCGKRPGFKGCQTTKWEILKKKEKRKEKASILLVAKGQV